MSFEDLLNIILSISIWTLFKVFILFAMLLYMVFAFVVLRQVEIMTATFKTGYETHLRIIAWGHLGLIVLIFFACLIFL